MLYYANLSSALVLKPVNWQNFISLLLWLALFKFVVQWNLLGHKKDDILRVSHQSSVGICSFGSGGVIANTYSTSRTDSCKASDLDEQQHTPLYVYVLLARKKLSMQARGLLMRLEWDNGLLTADMLFASRNFPKEVRTSVPLIRKSKGTESSARSTVLSIISTYRWVLGKYIYLPKLFLDLLLTAGWVLQTRKWTERWRCIALPDQ